MTLSEDFTPCPEGEVALSGLHIYAYHGVDPQERKVGNRFEVDVSLRYKAMEAMASDNVSEAISYADISETVKDEMSIASDLLENVAWRIGRSLCLRFGERVTGGMVRVTKLCPPMGCQLKGASYTLRW